MKKGKKKNGFTLVELIVVITLLIIVAGIFSISLLKSVRKQKVQENADLRAQIISAANAYVSVNPEKVENLFNGYGYVDITIRDLIDDGLIGRELKDAETGEKVSEDEKIRIKLTNGDYFDFNFSGDDDENPNPEELVAWKFVAEDLFIDYSDETTEQWCKGTDSNNKKNIFTGLIEHPATDDYSTWPSRMYMMNNKEGDPDQARMFTGNYFDENATNLRMISCNVNPSNVGTYNITYKYFDEGLGTEKTFNRTVYVNSSNNDIVGFTAIINNGQPIVRGTDANTVPITIKEIYRAGTNEITTTVGALTSLNYEVVGLVTDTVGDNFSAKISRIRPNSDGTMPDNQRAAYRVIPDVYTLTFNPGNGSVNPRSKLVTYSKPYGELATPVRSGYDFVGWFTEMGSGRQITSETIFNKWLPSDHTIYARWEPKKFTVTFNANSGSVSTGSKTVTYDSTYGTLPTPTKSGYDFTGWYTAATGGNAITSNTLVAILSNQTLYAHWSPKTYTVNFNSNSCGSVNQSSKTVTYDSTYNTLPTTSKTNYRFDGWYTSPSGGEKVSSSTKITGNKWTSSSSSVTLYARCTYVEPYTPPSYTPSNSRPSSSGGSSGYTGSSSHGSSCTVTCSNPCGGNYTAAAEVCSSNWNKVQNNPNLTAEQKKAQQDALHSQAMTNRAKAEGVQNPKCDAYSCKDSSGKTVTSFNSNTGSTTRTSDGKPLDNASKKANVSSSSSKNTANQVKPYSSTGSSSSRPSSPKTYHCNYSGGRRYCSYY